MDAATALGLVLGLCALALGQLLEGGSLSALLEPTAAVIVFGGTAASALLGAAPSDLVRGLRMLPQVFVRPSSHQKETVARLVRLASVARRSGLMALDERAKSEKDPLLSAALQRVVDGTSAADLRRALENDALLRAEDQLAAVRVIEAAGAAAPTMGILGAVLGLVHVMGHLREPAALGEGIATAFVATLYGVGAANLVLLPVAAKLRRRVEESQLDDEIVIEGAVAIQDGESPTSVESRLSGYVRRASRSGAS